MSSSAPILTEQILNDVLVRLHRSLLQYVGECGPWASAAAEQEAVSNLVQIRHLHVGELVELMTAREAIIDFGVFPTEFTDLHFVGLDYLLGVIVAEQKKIISELESAVGSVSSDAEATGLLNRILVDERANLAKLQSLAGQPRQLLAS